MGEPMGVTKARCPGCRSRDLTACEVTEASMLFDITAGVMTRLSHSEDFDGFVRLELTCRGCGHRWKPRGKHQVTDLLEDA